jgi:hypothetical protein
MMFLPAIQRETLSNKVSNLVPGADWQFSRPKQTNAAPAQLRSNIGGLDRLSMRT